MTRLDLVVWDADQARAVGFVNPATGELVDAADASAVAEWFLAFREFLEAIARPAGDAALELLNAHLDTLGRASDQLELPNGGVVEIKGETKGAADDAVAVEDARGLRDDLDVLVKRGDLALAAADDAVAVETVTTYTPNLRRVKALAARDDVVGETVRDWLVKAPRDRRRPTVKRIS